MKGLELSKEYYKSFGEPMLRERFPELFDKIAVGLCGSGSECFGFDDDISRDHDMEPGFCIFLPSEDIVDRRSAFLLERAYSQLPKEFGGLKRSLMAPAGGRRMGPVRTADFFAARTGLDHVPQSFSEWLSIPEYALAEAVNGEIFYDGLGEFSAVREALKSMPEDVRLKKLAGRLIMMSQSGKYNFERCTRHGELAAAQLAVNEFVQHALHAAFLLNKCYAPFYKWVFRALKKLPQLSELADPLEYLLCGINGAASFETRMFTVEEVCIAVAGCAREQGISENLCDDIEKDAWSVNDHITDAGLRNANILAAV